jgi:MYXO-CTERM domain-containing protein
VFLVVDLTNAEVDVRWVGPSVLIGAGALGLAASVRRREHR